MSVSQKDAITPTFRLLGHVKAEEDTAWPVAEPVFCTLVDPVI